MSQETENQDQQAYHRREGMPKDNVPEEEIPVGVLRSGQWFSWLIFLGFIAAAYFGYKWLNRQPKKRGALLPLRGVYAFNTGVRKTLASVTPLQPEFPKSKAAKPARVNGNAGMGGSPDTASYIMRISHASGDTAKDIKISYSDLKKLPFKEVVHNFKCIEGWSQVTWWGGVAFADVARAYNLGTKTGTTLVDGTEENAYTYAGFETLDKGYYVGIDMPSMMHPQTILAYQLNGAPLPANQGAPVRLIIPIKYGIKSIKKIGRVFFSDVPPRDYWAEKGYDYDSGL